jgi:EmrB/QacA subfamily drug resistance transporter
MTQPASPTVRFDSAAGRWIIGATVLGSGIAFLDGTVVNVALPAIGADLGTSLTGLQWVVNAYLITLSSLLLLGGSLGDRLGRRRVFVVGLVLFAAASALCAMAPSVAYLGGARALQGVGGALLVPGSLAIIAATFHPDDRARAIGAWSGLASVTSSIGPFVGGWLIDSASWRLVFLINIPLAAVAIWIAMAHVPETSAATRDPLDIPGAVLVTTALAALSYAAIEHGSELAPIAAVAGAIALIAFVLVEHFGAHPMLPLTLFHSRQFSGTNLTTFAVYCGLGGAMFLVVLRLQISMGYSALEAGSALVPFTIIMATFSSRAGALSQRIGARLPLTVGPVVAGTGILILSRLGPGDTYLRGVLPGVVTFGAGMAITVAPLTAAVLGSVSDQQAGVASGVNNAVARFAGLIAVAALPALAGIGVGEQIAQGVADGYSAAMRIAAIATASGGIIAAITVRRTAVVQPTIHPDPTHACADPALVQARQPVTPPPPN